MSQAQASPPIVIQRLALVVGALTAITPPGQYSSVVVGNVLSNGDTLEVHTDSDGTQYVAIAPGFERAFLPQGGKAFWPGPTAFWLKSQAGGAVVLIWS